jgi:hypothetical protein
MDSSQIADRLDALGGPAVKGPANPAYLRTNDSGDYGVARRNSPGAASRISRRWPASR